MITKVCPNCKNKFKTYPSINQKHCSSKCANEIVKKQTYEKYKCICKQCGKEFLPPRPKEGGIFCSYSCSGIGSRKERVLRNGYWYVYSDSHPNRNKQSYIPEHHLIMENYTGKLVEHGYIVHHIDEDKKNNSISNLELMTDVEHKRHHMNEQHKKRIMNTDKQRNSTSIRMKKSNPYIGNSRGSDGKFIKTF